MSSVIPSYADLADLSQSQLAAALEPVVEAHQAEYEDQWVRRRAVWQALILALEDAATTDIDTGTSSGTVEIKLPWLKTLITEQIKAMSERSFHAGNFAEIRTLERLGLVELEADDDYILAMVSGLGDPAGKRPRADEIRNDPELIDRALWRVFEVEGGGEVSLANVDKFGPLNTWQDAFLELVEDQTLPRAVVIDKALSALASDFSTYRVGWFSRLLKELAPTVEEITERQSSYVALLSSQIGATVSFAVKSLQVVDKAGALNDELFVAACQSGFYLSVKSTAKMILALLERVTKRASQSNEDIAAGVAWALEHKEADIQSKALKLLKGLNAVDTVAPLMDSLAPSVAKEAAEWLGVKQLKPVEAQSEPLQENKAKAVQSVADSIELVQRMAALLEDPSDYIELELVLSALVALDDYQEDLLTLKSRAEALYVRDIDTNNQLTKFLAAAVIGLVGEPVKDCELLTTENTYFHAYWCGTNGSDLVSAPNPCLFLTGRLAEITKAAAAKREKPNSLSVFATPTDTQCWIDCDTLVQRAKNTESVGLLDQVAALLRLSAGGRKKALSKAMDLRGEFGQALRYALGGEVGKITTPALWVAAARARNPLADDQELIAAGLDAAGQGRVASYCLTFNGEERTYNNRFVDKKTKELVTKEESYTSYRWMTTVTPEVESSYLAQPTVVTSKDFVPDWKVGGWLALVWPHDAESFFANAALRIIESARADDAWHVPQLVEALRTHPGRLGRMSATALAAGLATKSPVEYLPAVEAFAELVPAGRIGHELLAEVMAQTAEMFVVARWAARLEEASGYSQATDYAVQQTLTYLLPQLPIKQRGINLLVKLLYERSLAAEKVLVSDSLQAWLKQFSGSSAAAKAAKLLLELQLQKGSV